MIICSVWISYCICRKPSWTPILNQTAALLSFGWVFGFQLDSLENHLITIPVVTFTREKPKVPGEIFEKISFMKIRFLHVKKKTKFTCVKTKNWSWRFLTKSLNVPFFADVFQFCLFFFVSSDFYTVDPKFYALK